MIAPLRPALMLGCALGALCLGARADAQAFNADPTTSAGAVSYDRATPGVETITIDSPTAIINWVPNVAGNPIIFLPFGNTATFTNGSVVQDFVVLNRIMANAPIRFDGTVISQIQDFAIGTTNIGGTVIFSSPGGIILGPTAVFDVGNLVLTSLNVVDDGAGNFYDPAAQSLQFQLGGIPGGFVLTMAGAQINALNEGSFVAIVSPQIVHGGAIRVNGSAAFIAGEQVQMNVNQGLFDIIIKTGTDRVTPIIHTGSTTGPASTALGDNHGIFLVAMPKNQAITAILQGNVGFDAAVDAAIENGVVVLSAGFNVAGGQVDRFGDFGSGPVPGVAANFEIRGGTITSDLFGFAVTDMLASGMATGSLAFSQDVSLFAGRRAHLFAGANQTVTVGGNALVSAAQTRSADPTLFDFIGGEALIFANQGGALTIAGNATVDASAVGRVDVVNSRAGNGTGGTAGIRADAGTVQIAGDVTLLATGEGGKLDLFPDQGGTGQGGTASVQGLNGGTLTLGGTLGANASGTASRQSGAVAGPGAPGIGGTVSVGAASGSSVTITGATTLTSNGIGGEVLAGAGNVAGLGQGGTVTILSGGTLAFGGALGVTATGTGGAGPGGGAATGGTVNIEATGGQILLPATTAIDAAATGGIAQPGGAGGSATGGNVALIARSGANASLIGGGAVNVSVLGQGGTSAAAAGMAAGPGGDGRGGTVRMLAESGNGTLQLGAVGILAGGAGGTGGESDLADQGGDGGDGFGGDVQLGTVAGPAVPTPTGSATFASVNAAANGTGGSGGVGGGAGGNGNGGRVALVATGATATIAGTATLGANASGGAGGDPGLGGGAAGAQGAADGGEVRLDAAAFGASPGTLAAGTVTGTASATGAPGAGNSPGEWHVTAAGGGAVNVQTLTLTAQASGTPAVRPFSSLEAPGGTINVQTAQLTTPGEIRVIADGAGRIAGGTFSLDAGDDVTVSHSNRGANFTIDVAALDIEGDNVTVGEGSASRAAGLLDIAALGNVTVGGLLDGQDIVITGAAIDVAASGGIGSAAATDSVDIQVTGNAAVAGQVLGRDILLDAAAIGVAAGGAVGGAATDRAELNAAGNATVDGAVLGGDVVIRAGGLAVGGTGAIGSATTTDSVDIQVTGNAAVAGQILGRDILLNAAAINVAATGVIGGGATDLADLRAVGNLGVAGRVLGRTIRLASADIDIGATGAIGDAGTQLVELLPGATGQTVVLGGAAQGPGYTLGNAEAGRIRAGTLRLVAPPLAGATALVVRDLTLNGGGAATGIGLLDLVTQGVARIEGALLLANAAAGNGIAVTATQRLEVVTPAASIRVRDGAGAPAGTLTLASNNIWVASQAIIDRLLADPDYAGRDDDLIDNDGVDAPRGYVEAGGVTLATAGTLFVQNSTGATGAFLTGTDFGGITVGAGGLAVQSGGTPATVTIFGRRLNADGSFTTGDAFFATVNFTAAGGPLTAGYTGGSTLNTCIIVTGQCPSRLPPNTGPSGRDPTIGPTGGSVAIPLAGADDDELVDSSFASDPLIEEPVTSGGESSLWECDRDEDGDCDDQDD